MKCVSFFILLSESLLLVAYPSPHNLVLFFLGNFRITAEEQEKKWAKIDETIRHQPAHDAPTLADEQVLTTWQRRHWYTLICTRFWSSDAAIQSREETTFKGLRREFILDRALEEPFAPKDAAKRLKHSFNFGRYLGLAQIHILSHAVEVQKQTWFFFGVTAIAFYGIAVAVHERVMVRCCYSPTFFLRLTLGA